MNAIQLGSPLTLTIWYGMLALSQTPNQFLFVCVFLFSLTFWISNCTHPRHGIFNYMSMKCTTKWQSNHMPKSEFRTKSPRHCMFHNSFDCNFHLVGSSCCAQCFSRSSCGFVSHWFSFFSRMEIPWTFVFLKQNCATKVWIVASTDDKGLFFKTGQGTAVSIVAMASNSTFCCGNWS